MFVRLSANNFSFEFWANFAATYPMRAEELNSTLDFPLAQWQRSLPGRAAGGHILQFPWDLVDHNGVPIEIRVAEKSSPNAKSVFAVVSAPPGVQGAVARSKASITQPRRLAHILLFTSPIGNGRWNR